MGVGFFWFLLFLMWITIYYYHIVWRWAKGKCEYVHSLAISLGQKWQRTLGRQEISCNQWGRLHAPFNKQVSLTTSLKQDATLYKKPCISYCSQIYFCNLYKVVWPSLCPICLAPSSTLSTYRTNPKEEPTVYLFLELSKTLNKHMCDSQIKDAHPNKKKFKHLQTIHIIYMDEGCMNEWKRDGWIEDGY